MQSPFSLITKSKFNHKTKIRKISRPAIQRRQCVGAYGRRSWNDQRLPDHRAETYSWSEKSGSIRQVNGGVILSTTAH